MFGTVTKTAPKRCRALISGCILAKYWRCSAQMAAVRVPWRKSWRESTARRGAEYWYRGETWLLDQYGHICQARLAIYSRTQITSFFTARSVRRLNTD